MRGSGYVTAKCLIFVALSLSLFSLSCGNSVAESARTNATKGERAIDFTLKDLNGTNVSLADFQDKQNVLLICTTTWCPHCVTIIPGLKEIHSKYSSKGLEVMAIYINESEKKLRAFSQKHAIPYTVLLDLDGATASAYKIRGVPTLMLIDRNGIIQYRGYNVPQGMIKKIIE